MLQRFKQLSTHLFALSRPLSIGATSLKKLWIKSWVQSWHLTSCSLFQTFTLTIRVPDKIHAWFNTLIQTVKFVCFKASLIKLFILFVSQVHIVKLSFLHFNFFAFLEFFLSSGGTEPEILDFPSLLLSLAISLPVPPPDCGAYPFQVCVHICLVYNSDWISSYLPSFLVRRLFSFCIHFTWWRFSQPFSCN